jgi:hypothetical protein
MLSAKFKKRPKIRKTKKIESSIITISNFKQIYASLMSHLFI